MTEELEELEELEEPEEPLQGGRKASPFGASVLGVRFAHSSRNLGIAVVGAGLRCFDGVWGA